MYSADYESSCVKIAIFEIQGEAEIQESQEILDVTLDGYKSCFMQQISILTIGVIFDCSQKFVSFALGGQFLLHVSSHYLYTFVKDLLVARFDALFHFDIDTCSHSTDFLEMITFIT